VGSLRITRKHALTRPSTNPRVERSKNALRHSLQKLLTQKPLEQISIRDITADANVGYTTFFRHYPGKEALLADLAKDEMDRIMDIAAPLFDPDNTRVATLAFCKYVDDNRALWAALLTGGAAGSMRETLTRRAHAIADEYRKPVRWLPQDLGTLIAVSLMVEVLVWWLRQKQPMPPRDMAKILNKALIYPISHE
jgi:AcrR family transcriptional regulator